MLNNLIKYIKDEEYIISVYEKKIHIFNYKKIIDIRDNFIKIELKDKVIFLKGKNFLIEKMDKKEVLINGIIIGIDII